MQNLSPGLRTGQILKEEGKDYIYGSLQGSRMELDRITRGPLTTTRPGCGTCSILTGHRHPQRQVKSPGLVFQKLTIITTLMTPAFPYFPTSLMPADISFNLIRKINDVTLTALSKQQRSQPIPKWARFSIT